MLRSVPCKLKPAVKSIFSILHIKMKDGVLQVINPLPIKDLCGIGSRAEQKLNLLGIKTIGYWEVSG